MEEINRKARAALSAAALEVKQKDPNSPLYSAKTFEELGLRKELLDGVHKVGYQKPSKIQEFAIPNIVKNAEAHFIGQAQAGTGKTAAFALSVLARIDVDAKTNAHALVVCPTRELANQVAESFIQLGQCLPNFGVATVVPNAVLPDKIDSQVIVGTIGSLMDAQRKKRFDSKLLKMVVIDEADQLIQEEANAAAAASSSAPAAGDKKPAPRGRGGNNAWAELQVILKAAPQAQICLFSATFSPIVMESVDKLLSAPAPGSKEPRNYTKITLAPEDQSLDQIHEFYFVCDPSKKFDALTKLFKAATLGSTVVFTNMVSTADDLHKELHKLGYESSVLHGKLTAAERDATMLQFREAKIRVLIVTNVFARGINIPEITTVINYDVPVVHGAGPGAGDSATYLHRIGRSGRFGADGTAITLITSENDSAALKAINAVLSAVNPETQKAKRKREIKKLTMEDISAFTAFIAKLEAESI